MQVAWYPMDTAPRDGTPVRLRLEPWGQLPRVYMWIDGAWRYGRGGAITGSDEQRAEYWRPATEQERHLDQDFETSRLDKKEQS